MPVSVSIVNACLRDGRGGSPTAVLDDPAPVRGRIAGASPVPGAGMLTDAERRRIPGRYGTSHAVFVRRAAPGIPGQRDDAEPSTVELRFFTAEGELPACGHGTVAALAFLTEQDEGVEHEYRLRVSVRSFSGRTRRDGDRIHAAFEPGPVTLRDPSAAENDAVLAALRVAPDLLAPGACVASIGRARMLVPLATPEAVAALAPDLDRLRAACDRYGLLGCYVHTPPSDAGRVVARMFAPSIGVPEDIANANSTACLAAQLAGHGVTDLSVDMGDALGSPATITAAVHPGPTGPTILVGGAATLARTR